MLPELFFFFTLLLSSFWTSRGHTGVVPSPPRFLPSIFIAHRVQQSHCSSIFHRSVANSRSRAFRKSFCAQEKVPTNLYEYAPGEARTLETDLLYQARGLIRHRGRPERNIQHHGGNVRLRGNHHAPKYEHVFCIDENPHSLHVRLPRKCNNAGREDVWNVVGNTTGTTPTFHDVQPPEHQTTGKHQRDRQYITRA